MASDSNREQPLPTSNQPVQEQPLQQAASDTPTPAAESPPPGSQLAPPEQPETANSPQAVSQQAEPQGVKTEGDMVNQSNPEAEQSASAVDSGSGGDDSGSDNSGSAESSSEAVGSVAGEPAPQGEPVQSTTSIKIGSQRADSPAPEAKPTAIPAPPENPGTIDSAEADVSSVSPPQPKVVPPSVREALPPELEEEVEQALEGVSVDDILQTGPEVGAEELPVSTRLTGSVASVREDSAFLELGGRNQGVLSIAGMENPPKIGQQFEVVIHGRNAEDGLYELGLPGAAVEIADWSQVSEGIVVEVLITGQNKGGLECEVGGIRGFIPASQISTYRVEKFDEYLGQRLNCLVTEAKPKRRNLVLSHRAVLEKEQEKNKKKLLEELAVGQIREGTVRNLLDFGAFVDLGGVDGLIHIRQLSWERVKHPSDVLEVGQKVKVKILKVDSNTGKISLAFREMTENPWLHVAEKYPVGESVKGAVSKLADFGAFVRLEAGVEGLIHISELDHKRVHRVSDVLSEGQEVETKIVSVDAKAQRIGLSLKALQARPEPQKKGNGAPPLDPMPERRNKQAEKNLKGGVDGPSGGEQFGLKW